MVSIKKLNKEELLKISGGYVRRVKMGDRYWYGVYKKGVILMYYSDPYTAFDVDDEENDVLELDVDLFKREKGEEKEGGRPKKRRRDKTSLVY